MRILKLLAILCISLLFIHLGSVGTLAMTTGFSTEEVEPNIQQNFLSNINLKVTTEEPKNETISCFDVNEHELIAIGSEDSSKKTVSIYKNDGTFQYAYTFNCSGSFGVEWDDNNLIIYFVRSDIAASFDRNGTNLEIREIQDTIDNNSYWNHSVFSTRKSIDDKQYIIKNSMGLFNVFASSYSQLIETDNNKNIKLLYDVSKMYETRMIITFLSVVILGILTIVIIMLPFIKKKITSNQ